MHDQGDKLRVEGTVTLALKQDNAALDARLKSIERFQRSIDSKCEAILAEIVALGKNTVDANAQATRLEAHAARLNAMAQDAPPAPNPS